MFKYKNVLMGLYIGVYMYNTWRKRDCKRDVEIIREKISYKFSSVRAYNDGDKRCWMKYCKEFLLRFLEGGLHQIYVIRYLKVKFWGF